MKPVIIDERTRKCPYCYTLFERYCGENESMWARHTYCSKSCAARGGIVERKQRMAAKRRVACGDS